MASRILPSTARLLSRRATASPSSLSLASRLAIPLRRPSSSAFITIPGRARPLQHQLQRRFFASEAPSAFPQLESSPSTSTSSSDDSTTPPTTKIDVSQTATKNPDGSTSYSASFPLPEELQQQKREYELTFTCKVCSTRSTHTVSHQGYHKGTVLISCPGCKNRHLIADHLKIFTDKSTTVEDILREKGETIRRGIKTHDGDVEILPPEEGEDGTKQ